MLHVVFLHPDLGMGDKDRLAVDAALALKQNGHQVSFLTNRHDRKHCFKETSDGTLAVTVVGDWLPHNIGGRLHTFCAYLRMFYMTLYICFMLLCQKRIDVVFCGQISTGLPLLRLVRKRPKILFLCTLPEQPLSQPPTPFLQRICGGLLNSLVEYNNSLADVTLVNSKYTMRIYQETYRRLHVVPDVLYPSLNTRCFGAKMLRASLPSPLDQLPSNTFIFLDINPYERKYNHALTLLALRELRDTLHPFDWQYCRLIIAGDHDACVPEHVEQLDELKSLILELSLQTQVVLLLSPKHEEKLALLQAAQCLLYPPVNKQFSLVPLEAMFLAKPVIATNSGGSKEIVVDQFTGLLREPQPVQFAEAMLELFLKETMRDRMGALGKMRVQQKFSFDRFSYRLNYIISQLLVTRPQL